jgi:hypothetical protein
MVEGWQGDHHFILFDEAESARFTASYEIEKHLAGHVIVGLEGWDDFIVRGPDGQLMTVPTVPIAAEFLKPLAVFPDPARLTPDPRFTGTVKWYRAPLVFGGSPTDRENMMWVPIESHPEVVRYWNDLYSRINAEAG